jgi:glyoxylase-like metal-dependent hydrolase (beta-lactamase superfamily II)
MSFSGSLCFHQGAREVRVLELGPGHSEADVVVHLPGEKIVFCGDVFVNGLPPMPGEGRVTRTIANYKAIAALEADLYVAGHGPPGTLADVRAQRELLERWFRHARDCFDRGLGYDDALAADVGDDGLPLAFRRLIVLASYAEFLGKLPDRRDPVSRNHLTVLQGMATEAKRGLGRQGGVEGRAIAGSPALVCPPSPRYEARRVEAEHDPEHQD